MSMTPEVQRIAIAEACGIKFFHSADYHGQGMELWGEHKNGKEVIVPDYLNDLNAMAEAEKTCITVYNWKSYTDFLSCEYSDGFLDVSYTAAQRAEAFLRTLNKWID